MQANSNKAPEEKHAITLIGCGTLGSLVAKRLKNQGHTFNCLINRTLSKAGSLAAKLDVQSYGTQLELIPKETSMILIATPDDTIEGIGKQLSHLNLDFEHIAIGHFSGALSTDVFDNLTIIGANSFSMHPFQTFSNASCLSQPTESLFNCFFGLQATDNRGFETGKQLIHDLGGKVMYIPKESKTLYHVAAVLVSNYTVTLTHLASEILSSLGLNQDDAYQVFEPIMQQTLKNLSTSRHIQDALTGPVERGDARTLTKHLKELDSQMPHLLPAYATFAMETVRVAIQKGSINPTQAGELLKILEEALLKASKSDTQEY
jgi:predicted short-subunit dehydrogenase-like oxidoreductase (DUF2520 family)